MTMGKSKKTKLSLGATVSKAMVVAVITVSFLVGANAAYAYTHLGGSWANVNPLYYAKSGSLNANDSYAYDFAKDAWNLSGTKVYFLSGTDWQVLMSSVYDSGAGWDGYTWLAPCTSGCTYNTAITYLNDYYTNGYSTNQRISVTAHELGHAIGLGHEWGSVLMNAYTCGSWSRYCSYGIYTPQADDRNGVNALYP